MPCWRAQIVIAEKWSAEHLRVAVRFGLAITRDARVAEPNPYLGVGFFKSILVIC